MRRALWLGALAVVLAAGCDERGRFTWARMLAQRRVDRYQKSPWFPGGREMLLPPQGTVPRPAADLPPLVREGEQDGAFATAIPLARSPLTLELGRSKFEIHCAACHGKKGDGDSAVARFMTVKKPPSFVEPPVSEYPPGRIFKTATRGYELCRSYQELSIEERWAVVEWVLALRASRAAGREARR